ncbi:MAG: PilT/PilU family type 4a pilus ATPase, partial [Gammaproteobacteria bacterium]|nr:PilT/PilU family type 4a pilus ATPase [Gammaproteobacteria bacterium]
MDITPYLELMVEKDASDLFFIVGSPVRIKIGGKIVAVGKTALTAETAKAAAHKIMNEAQRMVFEKELEADFAISLAKNNARFRINAFKQQGFVSMVLRYVKSHPPTLEELKVPEVLKELVMRKRGLILMVGATGSGKSTTLAAMINHRNENHPGHIITIEDPIEFVHPHRKSVVNQRELGIDTHSYTHALRSCMREAPDVILIGEIRDQETMQAALELCNTGHLAISTLHANNAHQAMQRIVNMFPVNRHKELYMDLSMNLVSVISQRLVISVDEKRAAVLEVMINSPFIADLI